MINVSANNIPIPINHCIKTITLLQPDLTKSVELKIGGNTINIWKADFTDFKQPISILNDLKNNSLVLPRIEFQQIEIIFTPYDNLSMVEPLATVDLYNISNTNLSKQIISDHSKLIVTQNIYSIQQVNTFKINNFCHYPLDITWLPTTNLTVKFKNVSSKSISITSVSLSFGSYKIDLPLKQIDDYTWSYDFKDQFLELSDRYKVILSVNGSNYESIIIQQKVCNVIHILSGMAGMKYDHNYKL